MPKSIISFGLIIFLIVTGCITNSEHTRPASKLDDQIKKYPGKESEIRQYNRDFENYRVYKNMTESIGYQYQVTQEEKSRWAIGNPEAVFQIGNAKYVYHHKININLICGENTFAAKQLKNKEFKWKISEGLAGKAVTSASGEATIVFTSDHADRFSRIFIQTEKNKYTSSLDGNLIIEVSKDECN